MNSHAKTYFQNRHKAKITLTSHRAACKNGRAATGQGALTTSAYIPTTRTLIVADDLTGACDAAIAFAQRGHRTRVLLREAAWAGNAPDVCAISTGTRDLPLAEALEQLERVLGAAKLDGAPRLLKKIDSVFRGNTVEEIRATVRSYMAELILIAPAYPALGRTSSGGVIHVRDTHGERQIAALEALREVGLNPLHLQPEVATRMNALEIFEAASRQHGGVVYLDAQEQQELELAARVVAALRGRVLWMGAGGLAHALAAASPSHTVELPAVSRGTLLLFAGSDHPVSHRQLAHLRERTAVTVWAPKLGSLDRPAPLGVVLVPVTCGHTTEQEITTLLEKIDPETVSCLFMTGGDTAALVCRALEVDAVDLQVEFAPGIPQGTALGGRFDGRTVVLKSGGFGEDATVSRIVDRFLRRNEVLV